MNILAYRLQSPHNNPKTKILCPLHGAYSFVHLAPLRRLRTQTHACMQCKVLSTLRFLGRKEIQCLCWTMVLCVNCIYHCSTKAKHWIYPKQFIEVLSMKHVPCYLHNGTFCTLRHFILLRGIDIFFSIPCSLKNNWMPWKRIPCHCPTETFWFYAMIVFL